jgi:hypothetical protein
VTNYSFDSCTTHPGVTHQTHEVKVPADAQRLKITSRAPATAGRNPDIDINLYDGTMRVMGSHTPFAEEGILLLNVTLAPYVGKTLNLQVAACAAYNTQYTVAVEIS